MQCTSFLSPLSLSLPAAPADHWDAYIWYPPFPATVRLTSVSFAPQEELHLARAIPVERYSLLDLSLEL